MKFVELFAHFESMIRSVTTYTSAQVSSELFAYVKSPTVKKPGTFLNVFYVMHIIAL